MRLILFFSVFIYLLGTWADIIECSALEEGRLESVHPYQSDNLVGTTLEQNVRNVLDTLRNLYKRENQLKKHAKPIQFTFLPDKGKITRNSPASWTEAPQSKFVMIGNLAGKISAHSFLKSDRNLSAVSLHKVSENNFGIIDNSIAVPQLKLKIHEVMSLVDLTIATAGKASRREGSTSFQEGQAIGVALRQIHLNYFPIKKYRLAERIKFYIQETKNRSPREGGILMGNAILTFGGNWEFAALKAGNYVFESGGNWKEMESAIVALFKDYSF